MTEQIFNKKKIVWIVYGNHPNHTGIAKELGKWCDLTLVMRKRHQFEDNSSWISNNYKVLYLPEYEKELTYLLFPTLIKNKFSKVKTETPPIIYFKGLNRELNLIKPDCVIANTCYMPGSYQAAKYCNRNKIPFVLQTEMQRLPNYFMAKLFAKMLLKTKYIFNSSTLILPWTKLGVEFGIKHFGENNVQKVKLCEAGIDTTKFFNLEIPKPDPNKEFKILCVSRMIEYKRQSDLIKAVEVLRQEGYNNIKLTLIGKGNNTDNVKKLIDDLNLNEIVTVFPFAADLLRTYNEHHLFILPSYNEAIGMVVPEAMACGLPVIVSDSSGATTYVEPGINGHIFKTGDVMDLSEKIQIFLNSPDKLVEYGKYAQIKIKHMYDHKAVAERLFQRLQQIF